MESYLTEVRELKLINFKGQKHLEVVPYRGT